jgi:hypothetical protein
LESQSLKYIFFFFFAAKAVIPNLF